VKKWKQEIAITHDEKYEKNTIQTGKRIFKRVQSLHYLIRGDRNKQNGGGTELGNMHSIHSETLALVQVTKFMRCITERETKGKQSSEQN